MSFRKRQVALSRSPIEQSLSLGPQSSPLSARPPGTRASSIDGRLVTSTGTPSLDNLLAGHSGLVLGTSLLVEENGTTDYAGMLLRYYAAEGVLQRHVIHVVGVEQAWGASLPGVVIADNPSTSRSGPECRSDGEKMKIAWRYEGISAHDSGTGGRAVSRSLSAPGSSSLGTETTIPFSHSFDLARRLEFPPGTAINYIPISAANTTSSPFATVLERLNTNISSSAAGTIHRLILPNVLNPAIYPPHTSQPHHVLKFFHQLRGLLHQYSSRLSAMITIPLELSPRSSGLVRWLELLCDGVLELTPFPHEQLERMPEAAKTQEGQPQGMVSIRKLPIFHERSGGGGAISKAALGDNLAFVVSRRNFSIQPFSLPPAEGDTESQRREVAKDAPSGTAKTAIEF